MPIRDFLAIDAPSTDFPVTNELQGLLVDVLSDDANPDGDNDITTALALAVVGLETQVRQLEAMVRGSNAERDNVLARLVNLEIRIMEAGVQLAPPAE
ncbi:hypothetical protein ACFQNE_01900 [Gordonia phosphorivorans]|uniref:Uncharacterized protein n=1 Tax=Gordonia phosphorivorans TaxID=1056982 RepID=A0ABV6H6L5_9ACTN